MSLIPIQSPSAPCNFTVLACSWLLFGAVAAAEPPAVVSPTPVTGRSGVFFGTIVNIDPASSSITVRAQERDVTAQRFYIDRQTKFEVDAKPATFTEIYFGDRAAIRYFSDGAVRIADTVHVVLGVLQRDAFLAPAATPAPSPAAKKKKKRSAKSRAAPAKH